MTDPVDPDPKAVEATKRRLANDPMMADLERFQRGEMTAEEFMAKYDRK